MGESHVGDVLGGTFMWLNMGIIVLGTAGESNMLSLLLESRRAR